MGKHVLSFLCGCLVAVLGCLLYYMFTGDAPKSSGVSAEVEVLQDTKFTDVNKFLSYVNDIRDEAVIDSVLTTAPPEQVQQIAIVCINKKGYIDRDLFYKEYLESYNKVYKYLPPAQSYEEINSTQPTSTTLPTIRNDTLASLSIVNEGTTQTQQK